MNAIMCDDSIFILPHSPSAVVIKSSINSVKKPKKKRTFVRGRSCCVPGCYNCCGKNPKLHFYRFPGRSYEMERKQKWIEAVRRTMDVNNPWAPTINSRVCSAHFITGKKIDIEADVDYVPSIFPAIHESQKSLMDTAETKMAMDCNAELPNTDSIEENPFELEAPIEVVHYIPVETSTVAIQTEMCTIEHKKEPNIFYCWNGLNEASTQTQIYVDAMIPKKKPNIVIKKMISRGCGSDLEMSPGFDGIPSITSEQSMRQLSGVSNEIFSILLDLIVPGEHGQPGYYKKQGKENRLLLFLMKMKLGLPFTVLGTIFCIGCPTASRIFCEVLQTLAEKTQEWIFWPSKESGKESLPPSFRKFPMCKDIPDCTDKKKKTPLTVEQKVLTFANETAGCTVKFLVAITADGFICKVSKSYEAEAPDSFIIKDCGFSDAIKPGGDLVLADKNIPQIRSEFGKWGVTLVGRAIQRVKLSQILSTLNPELLPYIDAIMHMACVIANTQPPVLKKKETISV